MNDLLTVEDMITLLDFDPEVACEFDHRNAFEMYAIASSNGAR